MATVDQDAAPMNRWTTADRDDASRLVKVLGPVVPAFAAAMLPRTEVVLHNLTKIPNSIEAIAGDLTGRTIGGPPTDLGLRNFSSGWGEHLIGYRTHTDSGVPMRSSSIFFHGESGRAVVCLCLNTDVSQVLAAEQLMAQLSAITTIDPALRGTAKPSREAFPATIEDLAGGILASAIADAGVPVDLMKKQHKVDVVRDLRERGFFAIRESVELASQALGVSRHTVYNYLNEAQE